MGQLLNSLGVLAVFFLVIGVVALIAWKLGMLGKPVGSVGAAADMDDTEAEGVPTPYVTRGALLSAAELRFYLALRAALPIVTSRAGQKHEPWVSAKVRLLDVLDIDPTKLNGISQKSAQGRIIQRHADFVLCDPETTRPFMLIELDDKSHEGVKRKVADEFLNRACQAAGLPILRIKAAGGYDTQTLARAIEGQLPPKAR